MEVYRSPHKTGRGQLWGRSYYSKQEKTRLKYKMKHKSSLRRTINLTLSFQMLQKEAILPVMGLTVLLR